MGIYTFTTLDCYSGWVIEWVPGSTPYFKLPEHSQIYLILNLRGPIHTKCQWWSDLQKTNWTRGHPGFAGLPEKCIKSNVGMPKKNSEAPL